MALKRLPTDKLEEESLIFLQKFFNDHNWEFARQARDKSGIDAEIEIVAGIKRSAKFLKCQIKAGKSYVSSESESEIRVRVQRKYVDHWNGGNFPVILIFYDPTVKQAWWKAIKEYFKVQSGSVKGVSKDCIVRFRREEDLLTAEALELLKSVADRKFDYETIRCEPNQTELLWSTWFPVTKFPERVWFAATEYSARGAIVSELKERYSFTVRAGYLWSLSNLTSENCELAKYCKAQEAQECPIERADSQVLKELLNSSVDVFAALKGLVGPRHRLYFPPAVLKEQATNTYSFLSLKGRQESRTKIYIQQRDGTTEYKHHAVGLSFIEHDGHWYLTIDPEWHFSYPYKFRVSRQELGARITSEKADTQNKDFLYLLHFWRQFLSAGSDVISIPSDSTQASTALEVSASPLHSVGRFRLFNDYVGPKGITLEDD
jgi:hypothetical protein